VSSGGRQPDRKAAERAGSEAPRRRARDARVHEARRWLRHRLTRDTSNAGIRPATDRAQMARVGAYLYLVGAGCALLTILLPGADLRSELGTAVVVGVAAVIVVVLIMGPFDRNPLWAFVLYDVAAIVLITLGIYFDGRGASPFALFYVLATAYGFYYFSWRVGAALMAFLAVAYGVVQAVLASPDALQRWLFTVVTLVMIGAMIGFIRRRMQDLWKRLLAAAHTDALTGIPNRGAFEDVFQSELERTRRTERVLSLLVGDLDHFKQVNDNHGHAQGDEVLRAAASALRENKRQSDTLARIGGEEFALLMPETRADEALVGAERLRVAVRERLMRTDTPTTISFGIASFPTDGGSPDGLMTAADRALYIAKELGRDRCVRYSAEVDATLREAVGIDRRAGDGRLIGLLSLADALDARYAVDHRPSQLVGRYAHAIAQELGLPPERVERVRLAARLHDIGKMAVPASEVERLTPLTERDSEAMREHPARAAELLSGGDLEDIGSWILAHHERPDGRGFPRGLRGDQIPLEASIIAVADAYEAMTSDRTYRGALGAEQAREELVRDSGTRFDAVVVDALVAVLDREGHPIARR